MREVEELEASLIGHQVSTSSSRKLTQELLVPLAAVLIEYPIAYVPISAEQTSFLNGQPLDIYECVLHHAKWQHRYTLLKFSCPSDIGAPNLFFSPNAVAERLKGRFTPRLQTVDESWSIEVVISTETRDRVAL